MTKIFKKVRFYICMHPKLYLFVSIFMCMYTHTYTLKRFSLPPSSNRTLPDVIVISCFYLIIISYTYIIIINIVKKKEFMQSRRTRGNHKWKRLMRVVWYSFNNLSLNYSRLFLKKTWTTYSMMMIDITGINIFWNVSLSWVKS